MPSDDEDADQPALLDEYDTGGVIEAALGNGTLPFDSCVLVARYGPDLSLGPLLTCRTHGHSDFTIESLLNSGEPCLRIICRVRALFDKRSEAACQSENPEVLSWLALEANWHVRYDVAANKHTPHETLVLLAADSSGCVADRAASRLEDGEEEDGFDA